MLFSKLHKIIKRKFRMSLTKPSDISPTMGCDPEFFFLKNGKVIGAEKILPEHGLLIRGDINSSKFIIDGVQAELNPRPNYCRANLGNEIRLCFQTLLIEMEKKGVKANFNTTVEISKKNLMELDAKSKLFGCAPSKSIYKSAAGCKIEEIDPIKYRTRAAGGHIHIGKETNPIVLQRALVTECEKTVKMLDIICGNTCVLVDRDEGNIERRKVYGRAGEYRLPPHGLEYRTLSNFWLTSNQLLSLAFGLARLSVQLMADTNWEANYKAFTSAVKEKDIHTAINENDFDLAMANFKAVEHLILETSRESDRYAITPGNIRQFHHFVEVVQNKGLKYWFPTDPVTHWTTIGDCHDFGFNGFLYGAVGNDMIKSKAEVKKAA